MRETTSRGVLGALGLLCCLLPECVEAPKPPEGSGLASGAQTSGGGTEPAGAGAPGTASSGGTGATVPSTGGTGAALPTGGTGSFPTVTGGTGATVATGATGGVVVTPPLNPPACDDNLKNGTETGVDCGGSCDPCLLGGGCVGDGDCAEGGCFESVCSLCGDGVLNGDETDLDCGGTCAGCPLGGICVENADCSTRNCDAGFCGEGTHCLLNIPDTCAVCDVQNGDDGPICQTYLDCYLEQDCAPGDPCTQGSGACAVNTLGGGNAPQSAAEATYTCACPSGSG